MRIPEEELAEVLEIAEKQAAMMDEEVTGDDRRANKGRPCEIRGEV